MQIHNLEQTFRVLLTVYVLISARLKKYEHILQRNMSVKHLCNIGDNCRHIYQDGI